MDLLKINALILLHKVIYNREPYLIFLIAFNLQDRTEENIEFWYPFGSSLQIQYGYGTSLPNPLQITGNA